MTVRQLNSQPEQWWPVAIAVLALALRLSWVLVIWPNPSLSGGDAFTYLDAGQDLANGGSVDWNAMLAIGPLYPLFIALFYWAVPGPAILTAIRICQAILDTAMCLFVFDLGRRLFDSRVGVLAGGLLALDLRFITQVNQITTETLFIFLFVAGVWAFVVARESKKALSLIGANGVLMLATFTRAIALPVPLLLTGSLLLPKPTRQQFLIVGATVGLVVLGVVGWSVYQYQVTGQWVIVSDGFGGNFWMGSREDGQWHGSVRFQEEIDELRKRYDGRLAYLEDAFKTIAADPVAYARLLFTKLTQSYLQPHGTVTFPGESLKELLTKVFRGELSPADLITGDFFWPKLYIYFFHFFGIIGGLLGLWLSRHEWLKVLPLSVPIVYLTATYTILTIIPRYLFPIMPFYMVLAAFAFTSLTGQRRLSSRLPSTTGP